MTETHAREKWGDTAKGIGMLSVMVGHLNVSLSKYLNVEFVYAYHLLIFFLLAGYYLRPQKPDRTYLISKSRRLLLPYGISCFVIMLVDLILLLVKGQASGAAVLKSILSDLLRSVYASGFDGNFKILKEGFQIGALWFIPAMFFALLMFELLLQCTKKSHILGPVTFLIMICGMLSAKWIWLPFSLQSAMMAEFFLWIGYEIKKREVLSRIRWYHALFALAFFVFGCFAGCYKIIFASAAINSDFTLTILTGLAGCLVVYYLSYLLRFARILPYIGRNSLYVLCVHGIMLEGVWQLYRFGAEKAGITGVFGTVLNVLVYFLVPILFVPLILLVKKKRNRA